MFAGKEEDMAKLGTTRVEKHIRSLFPDGVISRVQVLEYGDDPAVEPGDVAVRVFLHRPDQPEGEEPDKEIVGSFEKANRERLKSLNDELPRVIAWVEFQADSPGETDKRRRHVLKIGRGGRAAKPLDEKTSSTRPPMSGSRAAARRCCAGRWAASARTRPMRSCKTGCVRSASLKPGSDRALLTRRDQVPLTAG